MPTLTWTGKEDALRAASLVPFRLLEPHTAAEGGIVGDPEAAQDNLLIQGDNLEALKALLPYYAGRVKCIYIDPPYNTGSAFEHYNDNLEHSTWLSMMYPRLELLRELLAEDGSIWVSIDDREGHYLKPLMDEIFGRVNFIATFIWQKVDSPNDNKVPITPDHEFILCFAKNWEKAQFKKHYDENVLDAYPIIDESGRRCRDRLLKKNGKASLRSDRPSMFFEITAPDGTPVLPIHDDGREARWALGKKAVAELIASGELIWKDRGEDGQSKWIPYTREYGPESPSRPNPTILLDCKTSRQAKKHQRELLPDAPVFDTVKPEQLISRIFEIATEPKDLILDSFLGSGTTAAVAHKMDLRWIGVEMGEHATTHCLPRLCKVIEGEQGGISEDIYWKGGGGFRFVKLGETLFDAFGRLNPKVKFADLAAFVWWRETKAPAIGGSIKPTSPFLGIHEGRGLYLLYDGILGDNRPKGGNVLTPAVLASFPKHEGPRVVYAEATTYSPSSLARMNITFKQIPYDLGSMPLLAEGALEYAAGLMPEAPQVQGAGEEGDHV